MKVIIKYLLGFSLLLLVSCSQNVEKSDAFGNFEVDDIIVSSESNGRILQLDLEEGQKLEANEVIGYIDSIMLVLKKEQLFEAKKVVFSKITNLDAQIDVFLQQKENLEIEVIRIKKLIVANAATPKQMDDLSGKLKLIDSQINAVTAQKGSIRSEISSLNKQIDQLQESINKCKIGNPIKGTVLTKFASKGEITAFGKPIYKIADLNSMNLKAYISGSQLADFKLGQSVKVLIDKGEDEYYELVGKIIWIASNAEFTPKIIQTKEERVNLVYAVKVHVQNDGRLKIGMPGEIRVN